MASTLLAYTNYSQDISATKTHEVYNVIADSSTIAQTKTDPDIQ